MDHLVDIADSYPSLDVVFAVGLIAGAVLASIVVALMVWGGSKI